LAHGRNALQAAERVLLGKRLRDVSGRLGGVPHGRHGELPPADVGERLPAQRLDVALVAGRARRAYARAVRSTARCDPARQRRRALRANLTTYDGGCHCGRVRFRVTASLERVSECNCSICTKKGILHLIVPRERFELLSGDGELSTYRFN